jgi:excisionase family DNA binding protein
MPTQDKVETPAVPKLAYTMQETADALGVSYLTVHRLLKRGMIRSSSALRHKVIPVTEIQRFLKDTLD